MFFRSGHTPRQQGFSLLIMLVGIIVLAGTLVYLLAAPGLPANSLYQRNIAAQLVAQARHIQQQIYGCAAGYPEGDRQARLYNALPAGAAGSSVAVSTLTCPGTGQNLWTGGQGDFPAQQPAGFGGWTYQADPVTGVISIAITSLAGRDMRLAISLAVSTLGPAQAYSTGTPASRLYVRIVH